jgi:hypothetical protein
MDYYEDIIQQVENRDQWSNRELAIGLDIPRDKLIIIPPHIPYFGEHFEGTIAATQKYVKDQLDTKGWNKFIVFDLRDESFATGYMRVIDKVIKPLIIDWNFPIHNIIYVTAAADVSYNRKVYFKYCAIMNYLPVPLCFTNTFEASPAKEKNQIEVFHSTEPHRRKKILCLNMQPRAHRLVTVSEIVNRGLRDNTYLSFVKPQEDILSNLYEIDVFFPNLKEKVTQGINSIADQFPINLTLNSNIDNMHILNESDLALYKNSLFSLVNETLFHHNVDYVSEFSPIGGLNDIPGRIHCFPSTFHTEKTWKTIRAKHPFIITSVPNTLNGLHELGYKTFHPYIDESYDTINDDETRLMAIMDEVERLCNMTDDETRKWLANVQPICKFNYDLLRTKKLEFNRL